MNSCSVQDGNGKISLANSAKIWYNTNKYQRNDDAAGKQNREPDCDAPAEHDGAGVGNVNAYCQERYRCT